MESFWSTLKLEIVYRQDFDSHEQARRKVSPELPVGRRTHPQQKVRQRSGMGPKPALEAITLTPRAQRESRSSPELPVGRRTHPAEPIPTDPRQPRVPSLGIYVDNHRAAAGWGRSPRWKRSTPPSRAARKLNLPRAYWRAQDPIPRSPCQPTTHSSESPPSVSMSAPTPARA